jgi:hypothetical protein
MADIAESLFRQLDRGILPQVSHTRQISVEEKSSIDTEKDGKYYATDWNIETKIVLCDQFAEKEARQICKKVALPKRTENMGWESIPGKKYAPVQGNRDFMKLRDRIKREGDQAPVNDSVETCVEQLELGCEVSGTAKYNVDSCYFVRMMQPTATLVISLVPTEGDPDLYCSTQVIATHKKYMWRSMLMTGQDRIEIAPKDPNFICGNYYITVCNRSLNGRPASYLLKAQVNSRTLQTLRADSRLLKSNRLHMKQLKIATQEADDKVTHMSVASGWGKWRNAARKSDIFVNASESMTPSMRVSTTPSAASDRNVNHSELQSAITYDMTISKKPFKLAFLDRSRLIFEKPVQAIEDVLHDVGSSLAANASQQMFREGTKLMLSRALYNKQPRFGKSTKIGKKQPFERYDPNQQRYNDSDSEDEFLFGGHDPAGAYSLGIDAFVTVGIPTAVLTHLMDSSDSYQEQTDDSLSWLVEIGKNVGSNVYVCKLIFKT